MALSFALSQTGEDTVDRSSYTTSSLTVTGGKGYILAAMGVTASGTPSPTVSGAGLTWTKVANKLVDGSSNDADLSVYYAPATASSSGALTINYGSIISRCQWIIVEVTAGMATAAAAVAQTAATAATAGTSVTVNLSAFGSSDNYAIGYTVQFAGADIVPGSGFTQIGAVGEGGGAISTMLEYKQNDTSVDASWAASNTYGMIALEIVARQPLSLSGSVTPTGALVRKAFKALAGSITPTGMLTYIKSQTLALAGSITPVGTLAKAMSKSFAGGITPVGSLVTRYSHKMLVALASVVATITGRGTGSATLTPDTTTSLTITPEGTDAKTLTPEGDDSVTLTPEDTVEG